jgi:two-component system, NarL family, sensor histidine kinase BarA
MSKRFVKITLAAKVRLVFGAATILIVGAALVMPWLYLEARAQEAVLRSGTEITQMAANEWIRTHPHNEPQRLAELLVNPNQISDLRRGPSVIPLDAGHRLPPQHDEAAREALKTFLGDAGSAVVQVPWEQRGQRVYRVYRAVRVDASCMTVCHASDPAVPPERQWKLNDLKALIEVQLPPQPPADLVWGRLIIIGAGALAFILATLTIYFITRRLVLSPVRALKSVADKVTEGDMTIRTALATGDEFEQLGRSFDEMLEAVTRSQEQLRAANRALDLKLNELAESNVALYESNRLKSEFLANVSHELRTPLNSIIGFADLLGEDPDERVRRYAGNIQTPARMLLRIINDLLDLARIEAGKVKVTVTMASVQDICETLVSLVTPLAQKKNLQLNLQIAQGLPALRTDAGKVQQILYNLLSNAIKFTPPGGSVTVRAQCVLPLPHPHASAADLIAATAPAPAEAGTSQPQEQAVGQAAATAAVIETRPAAPAAESAAPAPAPIGVAVHVADTGPGVSEAEQTAIFEKFYQSDSAHTREHGGVGLGLAIARDLAEILGGKLSLQSQSGQGATFTLTLPLEIPQET